MPLAFDVIATLFRSAYLSLSPVQVELIRFGLAFLALTPVTLLMGMSLPVLTRHLVRENPDVGGRIARLYGLNTLGAVLGSVVSGYVLIELLGLRGTTLVAVVLNLCAGGGAVLISRSFGRAEIEVAPRAERRPPLHGRQRLMLGVTFISGLVSLALEVLWTRMMLQATGSSIYVFVAVVAVFLIGIAGGSLVYERQKQTAPSPATLGALLAVAAALSLVPMFVSNLGGPRLLPLAVGCILPVTGDPGVHVPAHGPAVRRQRGAGQPGRRPGVRGEHRRVRGGHGAGRVRPHPDPGHERSDPDGMPRAGGDRQRAGARATRRSATGCSP